MKLPLIWLNDFVDISNLSLDTVLERLPLCSSEVEGVDSYDTPKLVVGKVVSKEKHPDADRLSVCSVYDGSDYYQVVCGAPNIAEGQLVPFAKVGAVLPEIDIKASKIRGIDSQGMICSKSEIGLGVFVEDNEDGIWVLNSNLPLGSEVLPNYSISGSVLYHQNDRESYHLI